MIVPVFAIYGREYAGATPGLIGLAVGVYGYSQALLQIPVSLIADKVPRKALIVIGLLLFSLGGAIAASSTSIWGVIIGRAVAGSGAVSAVVMALLADVTREQHRSKAMAAMGMSIGLSFVVAFSIGPFLTEIVGLSGLFWVTAVAGIFAIGLLFLVPTPLRLLTQNPLGFGVQLKSVLAIGDLNRLHVSIFALHLIMTAAFVMLPQELIQYAHIPVDHHGWVYMPLLLIGAASSIPAVIVAEVKRRMRRIFIGSVALAVLSLAVLTVGQTRFVLILGIGMFFIAFNLMEALIPSWLAKRAPVSSKATAMGVNASCQFLGAGLGGSLGGQLMTYTTPAWAWGILTVLGVLWLIIALGLKSPPYLSSVSVRLPEFSPNSDAAKAGMQDWAGYLLAVKGVEDVVVLPGQHVAYLKVDKKKLDDSSRTQLHHLLGQPIGI